MSFCKRIDSRNWEVYQSGCDRSRYEKAKFLQKESIKPGIIVDMGSGTLITEQMLSELYSDDKEFLENIHVICLDWSPQMMKIANARKKECKEISMDLILGDIKKPCIIDESVDTVLLFSTEHETYSTFGMGKFLDVLFHAYRVLKPGGRLIIRDGVKPRDETIYVRFNKKTIEERFYQFVKDYEPTSEEHIIKHSKYKFDFKKLDDGMIEVSLPNCFEFLVKYFYKENWTTEVKERWGVLTYEQWIKILEDMDFKIVYKNIHLLPYFRNLYETDEIELYNRINGNYKRMDYPNSHIILVAEKPRNE